MKKLFKRILTLSFIVLTVIFVLSSCGNGNQNSNIDSCKISFNNLKGAASPEINQYNSAVGISPDDMPKPEVAGWNFLGWYTASIGGELVDYIPAGSTSNYTLFAHWEPINYEITYNNVPNVNDPTSPNNTNPTSFNIETKLKIKNPKWSELVFSHWSDSEGNIYKPNGDVTVIPERTIGDLVLTANWKILRNIATPAESDAELYSIYSPNEGFLYFFYDIGTIEHVVLDKIDPTLYYKAEGMPLEITLGKTVVIDEETAQSVANTVSTSISKTSSWESATNWVENKIDKWDAQIGGEIGGEKGIKKLLGLKIAGHYNWGGEENESNGWTNSTGGTTEEGETTSTSVSTTISYRQEISSAITENISVSADLPGGYYAYVHAGNVRIIAVISYNTSTRELCVNTFTMLDNMHSMMMYYENVNQLNTPNVEGLEINIPEERVTNIIETSYYVKYDANGGEGKTESTIHSIDGSERVAKNAFTKTGYTFVGWETVDGKTIYQENESVTNIGSIFETITLKAIWRPNVYTIQYNTNSGVGEMVNSSYNYDSTGKLSDNLFYKTGYRFVGWNTESDGSGTAFSNGEEILNITDKEETITLFAQWIVNTYTIYYHANGGTGSTASSTHTYDSSKALSANGFFRLGWTFEGWSDSPAGAVKYSNSCSVENLTTENNGVVNLYAVWKLTRDYSTTFECYDKVTDSAIYYVMFRIGSVLDLSALKNTYGTAKITVSFTLIEEDDGYQNFALSTGETWESRGDILQKKDIETAGTKKGTESFTFEAETSSKNIGNYLYTGFVGSGFGADDFIVNNISITITFL